MPPTNRDWKLGAAHPKDPEDRWIVWISGDRVKMIKEARLKYKFLQIRLLPRILLEPNAVFQGWNRPGFENAFCYVGMPAFDPIPGKPDRPAPANMVFAIYITEDAEIVEWRWEPASEDEPEYPTDFRERFMDGVPIWIKT